MFVKFFILSFFYFAPVDLLPTSISTDVESDAPESESIRTPLIAEDRFQEIDSGNAGDAENEGKNVFRFFILNFLYFYYQLMSISFS